MPRVDSFTLFYLWQYRRKVCDMQWVENMNSVILSQLESITPEEQDALDGKTEINKELYMESTSMVIDKKKLLEHGKLIQIRKHTRFVHFPKHTHNYVEVIYMCKGETHHIINDEEVTLREGELLFLNQNASQEILPAGNDDIAVNFIILPEFFDQALFMMGDEKNMIREFIIGCLKGVEKQVNYLHFKVEEVLPIQNLVENLIWTVMNSQLNKRKINQNTMGLLLLHLMNHTDKVSVGNNRSEQEITLSVLRYVEEHYKDGQLSDLAKELHYDLYTLSRMIKKMTNNTYTELVQNKRLDQAAYLLENTKLSVADIGLAVGYDNLSYFHRIFKDKYGLSPKKYRDEL
jgi:AraC-like DNA-binding protein/quercetin dioxygenase-like cupin family protein